MNITEMKLKVADLVEGFYEDGDTNQVVAWGGRLEVRPEYQREFVYDDRQRDAVVNTVLNGFPLNILYFVLRPDGVYEVLDGQQRIVSLCRYAKNLFSVKVARPTRAGEFDVLNHPNLPGDLRAAFDDYELEVYVCEGTDDEKLRWFETINIPGAQLTKQELRNALIHSAWLTDAKRLLSRSKGAAVRHYGKYLKGKWVRQDYLETALRWAADAEGADGKDAIEAYMRKHASDANADDLWAYLERVFKWVKATFGEFDEAMRGVEWGILYNAHKDDELDVGEVRARVASLMADSEVQRKGGIYAYVLTDEERHLNLRQFPKEVVRSVYAAQGGRCNICGGEFELKDMQADHIVPWSRGGRTDPDNCQMLCRECNLKKSSAAPARRDAVGV